jgi:hypothetical protein
MAGESRHKPYREFLLGEPCCCYPCTASVVIHHNTFGQTEQHSKSIPGKRGKGQRASDDEGMPLCNHHHRQLHDLSGYFGGWGKAQLRIWQDAQVQRLRNIYAMRHPEPAVSGTATSSRATRKRIGSGWTVATIHSWLRAEARVRPAAAADALTELANLIEEDVRQ